MRINKIRTKILLHFLVITAISIISISILAVLQARKALFESTIDNFGILTEEVYYHLNRFLSKVVIDIKLVADNHILKSDKYTSQEKRAELIKFKNILRSYEDITLINSDGTVLASTDYNFFGDWKYRKYIFEAMKGKVSVSSLYWLSNPSRPTVSVACPIFGDNGKIKGVISAQLNASKLFEILGHIKIGKTGHAVLMDGHQRVIYYDKKGNLLIDNAPDELIREINSAYTFLRFPCKTGSIVLGNFFPHFKGQKGVFKLAWVPNWKILIVRDENEIFDVLWKIKLQIGYFATLLFGVVIILGFRFADTINEPIRLLSVGMEKIRAGVLEHKVEVLSSDEIGSLAATFNDMVDELKKLVYERDKAELVISEAQDEYQSLVETIPHGVIEYDIKAVIKFGNSAFYRMLGYAHGELFGKKIWDILKYEEEKKQLIAYHKKIISQFPEPAPCFLKCLTKTNGEIYIQMDWNYKKDEHGEVIGFFAVLTDITEKYK